ncbi:MAG: RES family NAD+ phosphorylase [Salibacteraceae bacterium]
MKVLDLTDPAVAKSWNLADAVKYEDDLVKAGMTGPEKYAPFQEIATKARSEGYNAIRFPSKRADGNNFVIYGDTPEFFKSILKPQMITPAKH